MSGKSSKHTNGFAFFRIYRLVAIIMKFIHTTNASRIWMNDKGTVKEEKKKASHIKATIKVTSWMKKLRETYGINEQIAESARGICVESNGTKYLRSFNFEYFSV